MYTSFLYMDFGRKMVYYPYLQFKKAGVKDTVICFASNKGCLPGAPRKLRYSIFRKFEKIKFVRSLMANPLSPFFRCP